MRKKKKTNSPINNSIERRGSIRNYGIISSKNKGHLLNKNKKNKKVCNLIKGYEKIIKNWNKLDLDLANEGKVMKPGWFGVLACVRRNFSRSFACLAACLGTRQ